MKTDKTMPPDSLGAATCSGSPACAICGKPATCLGSYEGAATDEYACDDCCGHGNEDGHCSPVTPNVKSSYPKD